MKDTKKKNMSLLQENNCRSLVSITINSEMFMLSY